MKRRVRGKANVEHGQQGQRTAGRPEAARRSYPERWLAAAPLSLILLPSREILFICTKGKKGNPHLSLLQREGGAALVLGHRE